MYNCRTQSGSQVDPAREAHETLQGVSSLQVMEQMCKTLRLDEATDGLLCFHRVLHLLVSDDLIQAVKANSRERKEGASEVYISVLGHGPCPQLHAAQKKCRDQSPRRYHKSPAQFFPKQDCNWGRRKRADLCHKASSPFSFPPSIDIWSTIQH